MKYRRDIDGLRAVAVLPVVFYHANVPGLSGGFVGVDVFFVISGFLITAIIAGDITADRFSLISFYERRARRILPALIAMIAASFAVGWVVLLPEEMKSLGQSAFATAFFVSNVHFALNLGYFDPSAEFAPLLHTWSLAVEEQFYLFFPLLLMLLARLDRRRLVWVVSGLSVLSLVGAVVILPIKPDWVFYLIFFRAWELGAGAVLALAAFRPPQRRLVREALAMAGLAAILIPVVLYDAATPFPGLAAMPPVLGASVLIWVGAQGGGSLVGDLLARRAVVWVGLISYSLYLWHWPILAFLRITLDTAILPLTIGLPAVVMSVVVAWVSWRLVEQPFRVRGSGGMGRQRIFALSALSLAGVLTAGAIAHVSGGFPARLPGAARDIAAVAADRNARGAECLSRSPAEGLCRIGAPASAGSETDFLFWGDSHANAMMPGMDLAAGVAERTGIFAGMAACPPLLDIQRVPGGRDCTRFNESVMKWLVDRPDIPLVILAARWTLSVEGTRFRGEAGHDVHLEWVGDPAARPDDTRNAEIFEAGLRQTVAAIRATGRQVILLGPVPEIGRNVPATSARHTTLGWTPLPSLTKVDYELRTDRTERILSQVAQTHDGVRYIALHNIFCDAEHCRTHGADSLPLYVDDDHISQTAARHLLPPKLAEIWQKTHF